MNGLIIADERVAKQASDGMSAADRTAFGQIEMF